MKRKSKKQRIVAKIELDFTATPARFEPNPTIDLIDANKAASGRRKIQVGEFTGGCCSTKVYGIVERGLVTRVELSRCKSMVKPPKFLGAVVEKAGRALKRERGATFRPMPVGTFINHAKRRFIDIDIGGGCIIVCIGDSCFFCCVLDGVPICDRPIIVEG